MDKITHINIHSWSRKILDWKGWRTWAVCDIT